MNSVSFGREQRVNLIERLSSLNHQSNLWLQRMPKPVLWGLVVALFALPISSFAIVANVEFALWLGATYLLLALFHIGLTRRARRRQRAAGGINSEIALRDGEGKGLA